MKNQTCHVAPVEGLCWWYCCVIYIFSVRIFTFVFMIMVCSLYEVLFLLIGSLDLVCYLHLKLVYCNPCPWTWKETADLMFCYLLNLFEPVLYRLLLIHGRRLCKWLSPDINGKNIIILPHYALYIYLIHLNYLYHHVQIFLCLNVMDNFVCDICLILVPGFLMSFECLLCYYTVRCTYMSLLYCGFVLYCLSLLH